MKGKNVLVAGASSGIGEGLARQFALKGANLILLARREERLKALAADLQRHGGKILFYSCDVTKDEDLPRVTRLAREELGPIDVAIANAGYGVVGSVEKLKLEDFRRQFETNVFGVLRTIYSTLEDLKKTKGRLAVIGSVNGYVALPGNTPYAMSKFAVRALCDGLADEVSRHGVSVTHVAPGFISTEIRLVDNQGVFHSGLDDKVPSWILMNCEKASRQIANAIVARKREVIITGHGKAAVFLKRHFPGVVNAAIRQLKINARVEPKTSSAQ